MTNLERIEDLAQQIYVARNNEKNRVSGNDLSEFIDTTIVWVNQFIPELEKETYWHWSRDNDYSGGVAVAGEKSIPLGDDIRTIVKYPHRPVYLVKDGHVVTKFDVVSPNMLNSIRHNRVAMLGRKLVFSRHFHADEAGATIHFDAMHYLPKLSREDVTLLDTVDPVQLIVLGVLKNQTLPDIVQGGLTPSFTQKYADLLEAEKYDNDTSSEMEDSNGDDMSGQVHGVGF